MGDPTSHISHRFFLFTPLLEGFGLGGEFSQQLSMGQVSDTGVRGA